LCSFVERLTKANDDIDSRKDVCVDLVKSIRVATGACAASTPSHSTFDLEVSSGRIEKVVTRDEFLKEFTNVETLASLATQITINFGSKSMYLQTVSVEIFSFLVSLVGVIGSCDDEQQLLHKMSRIKSIRSAANAFVKVFKCLVKHQLSLCSSPTSPATKYETETSSVCARAGSVNIENNISICLFTICSNVLPALFETKDAELIVQNINRCVLQ